MSSAFPILLYHRVGEFDGSSLDYFTVTPESFARQMAQLSDENWLPVSLGTALDPSFKNCGQNIVVITFDDGFACNREHAWPVLERYGFPSEQFIVSERLGQTNSWDGPITGTQPLLTEAELQTADRSLMAFHSHSATHVVLPTIMDDEAAVFRELAGSRTRIEAMPINHGGGFAYPFGALDRRAIEAVRSAGYAWACSCIEGLNTRRTDPFLLRRVEVHDRDIGWYLRLKLSTGKNFFRWPPQEVDMAKGWLKRLLRRTESAH